jgi:hypothetical protein
MAFSGNYMCTSFKKELLEGVHDLSSSSTQKQYIALYTSSATLNAGTTAYSATNEATSTGYTAGGQELEGHTTNSSGTTAFVDFTDETFGTLTITARGALIYKGTAGGGDEAGQGPAIAVLDFGADKTSTNGDFTIQFPTADASNAIIRIA